MALVGYSDSEDSDTEPTPKPQPAAHASSTASKPAFQKVVDRANPHKIKVSLPTASGADGEDDIEKDAPPAKKPKIGGGAFSGFNSFLPAPKRTAAAPQPEPISSKGGVGKGLGRGINLKTGATPGFSREPMPASDIRGDEDSIEEAESYNDLGEKNDTAVAEIAHRKAVEETSSIPSDLKPVRKPTMFKPLSVGRNKQKKPKKPAVSDSLPAVAPSELVATVTASSKNPPQPAPKAKPKVSLFSLGNDDSEMSTTATPLHDPLLHQHETQLNPEEDPEPALTDPTFSNPSTQSNPLNPPPSTSTQPQPPPQSLASLASTLPPSARRQLLGRHAKSTTTTSSSSPADPKILSFSPDAEYTYNEEYRASADAAAMQHKPVRGVAPGKHSLQQLVNAAVTQKEALEESFASGRANKREGGAKYGW